MKRYVIVHEKIEAPLNFRKKEYNLITDWFSGENGIMNGAFDEIATFDNLGDAERKIAGYNCELHITNGFTNVKFYSADIYYIAEQEYDDDEENWAYNGNINAFAVETDHSAR